MRLNQLLLSLLFLIISTPVFSQYEVTNYTVEDGIMSNDTRGIWQDSKGLIWLVDEYGLSRFNGREIKSFVGKEKHFKYGYQNDFRKAGDTLFYKHGEFLLNGEYHKLRNAGDFFNDHMNFKYLQKDSVVMTTPLSFKYGFISQKEASFFFNINDSSFHYSNSSEKQKIIRLTDFGKLIPLEIDITNLKEGNPNKFSIMDFYPPWFLDNVGRLYLKIKGNRVVRYDKEFKTDTIQNVTSDLITAFQTSSGKEFFFSNSDDFKCFEFDGEKLNEIAKIDGLGNRDKKIREHNNIIYICNGSDLFQFKNNKLSLFKSGVIDYEISVNGSIVYVSDKSNSDVYQVHDLNRGETIIDKVQSIEKNRKPYLFKDRETNIWVVSSNGFYKIVSSSVSQKSILNKGSYKASAFDKTNFLFSKEQFKSNKRSTVLKSTTNDSAFIAAGVDPAFTDSNYLWFRYIDFEKKNKVDLVRMNKKSLNYSLVHLLNLNTDLFIYPSNFNRFFFVGNRGFEVMDDSIKEIYIDNNESCFLFVHGYQYYTGSVTSFTSPDFGKIIPNYLLITKKLALEIPQWGEGTKETPDDQYLLFNTKNKEVKPFSFDDAPNNLLLAAIIDEDTHFYFVQEKTSSEEEKAPVKLYVLKGEELKLIKKINSEFLSEGIKNNFYFKTKEYLFFRNHSRELVYFNIESHELGTVSTTKFNVGLIDKVFPTLNDDVFYINDLNRSYLVDFSDFANKKDVNILKRYDFNASGFYEVENHMYFGVGNNLLCYDKRFVPPIDSFPLYLNQVKVYDNELNVIEQNSDEKREFANNQNSITFKLESVSHYKPNSIILKYILEGPNKSVWRLSSSESIYFENLSPGTYTFKVKAINEDGIESNQIEYSFTIQPPFWETWLFRIIVSLLAIGGIFAIYKYRLRKLERREKYLENKVDERTAEVFEQKKRAEHQHDLVKEKNREILDSINYAKRLQDAILPSTKIVSSYLVDSFIFYKPKDIVAGDFYFMDVIHEDDKKLVYYVAADCTGHGVPGAMVSIVGANGLKRCIQEFKLRDPGEILDKLAVLVADNFAQSEERIRDGMDLALCCLEMVENKTVKVYYAGANNPLWVINPNRKEIPKDATPFNDGGGFEIKANKQAIGYTENIAPFDTHILDVEEGDILYTFSDGFADQFGGIKGKKYKTANFKKFLVSIYNEPVEVQKKEIIQEFNNWKGGIDQVDDVCVIGVQL